MGGVSSASPENLEVFVKSAGDATDRLQAAYGRVAGSVEAFYNAAGCSPFVPAGGDRAINHVKTVIGWNQRDQDWIAGIRRAFIDADTNTLPDVSIAHSLAAQGINPNPPGQLTVDEPVYKGTTMYSGWTDDPVSTAAGNFYEPESDLAVPEGVAALAWPRSYNSRHASGGANGRGWSGWADTRLDPAGPVVVYHGPDGQEAPFARTDDGSFLAHPTLGAVLQESPEGFELRWRWASRHPGQTWEFDGAGRLRRLVDRYGSITSVERDDEGRIAALVHSAGRRLHVRWADGLVQTLECSDGRRVDYSYDAGRLVAVRRPGGGRRYTYGADGLVAEVFDDDGVRLVANTYDAEGRVLAQASPHGRVARLRYRPATLIVTDDDEGPATLFRHDPVGRLVELQLADGTRATRRFDPAGNPVEVVRFDGSRIRRTFDERGRCTSEAGPDGTRRFAYDDLDRVVATEDPAGVESRFEYRGPGPLPDAVTGPLGCRTEFTVAAGRITSVVDADGVETHLGYDGEGQMVSVRDGEGGVTRLAYHRSGQLARIDHQTGGSTRWEFDDDDRAVTATLPDGTVFTRSYSPAGRVLEEAGPDGWQQAFAWGDHGDLVEATDAGGGRTRLVWNAQGDVTDVEEPGGRWTYRRDEVGRIGSVRLPGGEEWRLGWNPAGLATVTDPAGHADTYDVQVDGEGTTLSVATAGGRRLSLHFGPGGRLESGETPEGPSRTAVGYDSAGRPTRWSVDGELVAEATYTPAGRLASYTRAGQAPLTLAYDRAGRAVAVDGPDGRTEFAYDWSGRPVRITDADGRTVTLDWDAGGRLSSLRAGERSARFTYDALGRPSGFTGPSGGRWEWDRDPAGHLVRTTGPGGGSVTVTRDGAGRILAATGPEGGRWSYSHGPSSRLDTLTDPLGHTIRYHWDATGQLAATERPDGSRLVYDWDPDGATVGVTIVDPAGDHQAVVAVERDLPGRSATLSDASGRKVRLTWDGQGRVVDYSDASGETRVDWSDPAEPALHRPGSEPIRTRLSGRGLPVRLEHPAVGEIVLERDAGGRLLAVRGAGLTRTWERDGNGDAVGYREEIGGCVRRTAIGRDGAGRIVSVTDDGVERSYSYDGSGRLVGATGPEGRSEWVFDRAGRLVRESGPDGEQTFTYDAADQILSAEGPGGPTAFEYDALGRRVAKRTAEGEVRYHWDGADRLVAVEYLSPDGRSRRVDLGYDPLGRLEEAGGHHLSWGAVEGPLAAVPSGIDDRELVALPGMPLARIAGDSVEWLSADWRGTVGRRDPWGVAPAAAPMSDPELGFLGEIEVEGLLWLRNRWYDPATHAFISRDPQPPVLQHTSATNPYLYAYNDPLQYIDPLGLKPITANEASSQIESWHNGHFEEIAVTVASVIAIGVMVAVAPEATALILPMVLGAAAGAGGTVASDLLNHRPIDWYQVVMDGALGAALAGGGATLAGVGGKFTALKGLSSWATRGIGAGYGAVTGAGFTAIDRSATGADFNLRDELIGAGGGALGGLAPHLNDDLRWDEMDHGLSPRQLARALAGGRDARLYTPQVTAATKLARVANAAHAAFNDRSDAATGAVGGLTAGTLTPPDPEHLPPVATHYPALPTLCPTGP